MARYGVSLPMTGVVYLEVEAASEAEAIKKALEEEHTDDMIESWEVHEQVNRGNVVHGSLGEADVQLIED